MGNLTVGSTNLLTFRQWGIMPTYVGTADIFFSTGEQNYGAASWVNPAVADISTRALIRDYVCDLGFSIYRLWIPTDTSTSAGSLVAARVTDITDMLAVMTAKGITDYILTVWSPPSYMKTPLQVNWGSYLDGTGDESLDAAYYDGSGYDYADYLVAVAQACVAAGYPAPKAIIPQNEPDVTNIYDSCYWTLSAYKTVVKQLRTKLNTAGLTAVQIYGPDTSGWLDVASYIGTPSGSGFTEFASDTDFRDAISGFSWHSYATDENKDVLTAMNVYPTKSKWMTETSRPEDLALLTQYRANSGVEQLDWLLNIARVALRDIVDCGAENWLFWGGWISSSVPGNQTLVYGNTSGNIGRVKGYYFFQKLWTTVNKQTDGWAVKVLTLTDSSFILNNDALAATNGLWQAPVDVIAFVNGQVTVIVAINASSSAKSFDSISGLTGTTLSTFISDSTRDMASFQTIAVASGVTDSVVNVPANSVILGISSGSAAPIPTDLPTEYGVSQSDFVINNLSTQQVLDEWNLSFRALASNSSAEQQPDISYGTQWFGDADEGILKLSQTNQSGVFQPAVDLSKTDAFESRTLGMPVAAGSSIGPVFYNGSGTFSSSNGGVLKSQYKIIPFTPYSGAALTPSPPLSYTSLTFTDSSVARTSGTPLFSVSFDLTSVEVSSNTKWMLSYQLGGLWVPDGGMKTIAVFFYIGGANVTNTSLFTPATATAGDPAQAILKKERIELFSASSGATGTIYFRYAPVGSSAVTTGASFHLRSGWNRTQGLLRQKLEHLDSWVLLEEVRI